MKVLIKKDLFNIVKRLKNIDKNYFVLFDTKTKKFEVHNKKQIGNTFAFGVKKQFLNKEVLEKAHSTMVRNAKTLFKQIEKNNLKLDKQQQEKILDKYSNRVKDYLAYASSSKKDCDFSTFNTTRWV